MTGQVQMQIVYKVCWRCSVSLVAHTRNGESSSIRRVFVRLTEPDFIQNSYIMSIFIIDLLAQRLHTIEQGNHIIAVYASKDEKFNEAFAFLKDGLQRNEVVVMTTSDMPKDEIRARMRDEWKLNITELESKGDIIIRTTEEVYFPDGMPNIQRTMAIWSTLVENCISKGKRGIRVFGDMTAFFKNGFTKELFEYESCLEQRFNFPAIGICAYDSKDISKNITLEQIRQLQQYHNPVWMEGIN